MSVSDRIFEFAWVVPASSDYLVTPDATAI
jgi:hypothetical protein